MPTTPDSRLISHSDVFETTDSNTATVRIAAGGAGDPIQGAFPASSGLIVFFPYKLDSLPGGVQPMLTLGSRFIVSVDQDGDLAVAVTGADASGEYRWNTRLADLKARRLVLVYDGTDLTLYDTADGSGSGVAANSSPASAPGDLEIDTGECTFTVPADGVIGRVVVTDRGQIGEASLIVAGGEPLADATGNHTLSVTSGSVRATTWKRRYREPTWRSGVYHAYRANPMIRAAIAGSRDSAIAMPGDSTGRSDFGGGIVALHNVIELYNRSLAAKGVVLNAKMGFEDSGVRPMPVYWQGNTAPDAAFAGHSDAEQVSMASSPASLGLSQEEYDLVGWGAAFSRQDGSDIRGPLVLGDGEEATLRLLDSIQIASHSGRIVDTFGARTTVFGAGDEYTLGAMVLKRHMPASTPQIAMEASVANPGGNFSPTPGVSGPFATANDRINGDRISLQFDQVGDTPGIQINARTLVFEDIGVRAASSPTLDDLELLESVNLRLNEVDSDGSLQTDDPEDPTAELVYRNHRLHFRNACVVPSVSICRKTIGGAAINGTIFVPMNIGGTNAQNQAAVVYPDPDAPVLANARINPLLSIMKHAFELSSGSPVLLPAIIDATNSTGIDAADWAAYCTAIGEVWLEVASRLGVFDTAFGIVVGHRDQNVPGQADKGSALASALASMPAMYGVNPIAVLGDAAYDTLELLFDSDGTHQYPVGYEVGFEALFEAALYWADDVAASIDGLGLGQAIATVSGPAGSAPGSTVFSVSVPGALGAAPQSVTTNADGSWSIALITTAVSEAGSYEIELASETMLGKVRVTTTGTLSLPDAPTASVGGREFMGLL